jgi:murein DD-endopeptidase MepM/ murein hydrolase activator NlpD
MSSGLRPCHRILTFASVVGWVTAVAAESVQLKLPVACEVGRTCFIQNCVDVDASSSATDYRCGTLTYDGHNGTDFRLPSMRMQRAGVGVLAAAAGRVVRVRDGVPDVSVRAADREAVRGAECGNGAVIVHSDDWETQYCHLARGSLRVQPGQTVEAGQPLGLVGLSGLTEYPHLHFTVRHRGRIADPFANGVPAGVCTGGEVLWESAAREHLGYQERAILNTGFAAGAVTMEAIEQEETERISPADDTGAIVAFVRTIGLKTGDKQSLELRAPTGQVIVKNQAHPLERNKAQAMLFAGSKRPPSGWDRGIYKATYLVKRADQVVLQQQFELDLK